MNPVDIILAIVLVVIIGLAVIATIKRRKKGGCSCGCSSCENCPQGKTNKDQ